MSTHSPAPLPRLLVEPAVRAALHEDLGQSGDLSASLLVPASAAATLLFRARQGGVLSGWQAARLAYHLIDPACELEVLRGDGAVVERGEVVARVSGSVRALLTAERPALNFLGRLSGVATLTAEYVRRAGGRARIAATRKTTPGLRALEKQAVRHGGGFPHRESLASAVMVKDNHIALAGGLERAMDRLRARADHMTKISVEVDTLEQLERLLPYEPDVVLLDNMGADTLREAVARVGASPHRRPVLEASGGVDLDTVAAIAASGVDVVSVGALTHSAPNFDIGLDAG